MRKNEPKEIGVPAGVKACVGTEPLKDDDPACRSSERNLERLSLSAVPDQDAWAVLFRKVFFDVADANQIALVKNGRLDPCCGRRIDARIGAQKLDVSTGILLRRNRVGVCHRGAVPFDCDLKMIREIATRLKRTEDRGGQLARDSGRPTQWQHRIPEGRRFVSYLEVSHGQITKRTAAAVSEAAADLIDRLEK